LQLISTIYSRQKKYAQAKQLSHEVIAVLKTNQTVREPWVLPASLGSLHQLKNSKTRLNIIRSAPSRIYTVKKYGLPAQCLSQNGAVLATTADRLAGCVT
jgi:hypothetical protein